MSNLVIPNVLVNGTGPASIVDAVALNANFTAIATAVNNIYPSQILPITSGQATFGATATGVGFTFLANDATATPLKAVGVSGQSANIFEVDLTAGGVKALTLSNAGAFLVGATTPVNFNTGTTGLIGSSTAVAAGALYLGGSTTSASLDYGIATAGQITLARSTGTTFFNVGAGGTISNGQINIPAATAFTNLTTAATAINTIGGTMLAMYANSVLENTFDTSGNQGLNGTLHQTSTIKNKKNIAPLSFDPLAIVTETEWVQYHLTRDPDDKQPHVGFIAENSSEWLGGKDKNYVIPSDLAGIACAAVARLAAKVAVLEAKLPTA